MLTLRVFFILIFGIASLNVTAQVMVPALEKITEGFNQVTGIRSAEDDSGRLFVLEREGFIRIIDNGQVLPQPFLDISDLIFVAGEHGLLGLAFHPNFKQNGYVYIFFSEVLPVPTATFALRVTRYTVDEKNFNQIDVGTRVDIFTRVVIWRNHIGGDIHFGPDGFLYVALGDLGGSGGDPHDVSQGTIDIFGKILRLDIDNFGANNGNACQTIHAQNVFGIPADNPFVNSKGPDCSEIWSLGLRNSYRFSFDRVTGDMFIADVGQNRVEEVNIEPAGSPGGANYGWDCREGNTEYGQGDDPGKPSPICKNATNLVDPILHYEHDGDRCSITGGYRFRGGESAFYGNYFFADFCSGEIFKATETNGSWISEVAINTNEPITSFGEDQNGDLLVASYLGAIYKLVYANDVIFENGFE